MSSVKQMLDEGYTDGFVVLHHGAIAAERYGDGVEPHEPHLLMSVTNFFAGSPWWVPWSNAVSLSPDDTVTDIIPEVAGSAYVTLDRPGAPQTDGSLCVTTRDLVRFG